MIAVLNVTQLFNIHFNSVLTNSTHHDNNNINNNDNILYWRQVWYLFFFTLIENYIIKRCLSYQTRLLECNLLKIRHFGFNFLRFLFLQKTCN